MSKSINFRYSLSLFLVCFTMMVTGGAIVSAQEFWFRGANPDTTKDGTPRVPSGSTKDPGFTPELGGRMSLW